MAIYALAALSPGGLCTTQVADPLVQVVSFSLTDGKSADVD